MTDSTHTPYHSSVRCLANISPTGVMSIARYARKERLPHGAQKEIALKLGVGDWVVSRVMNDKTDSLGKETVRKVRVAIARKLRLAVDEAFPSHDQAA